MNLRRMADILKTDDQTRSIRFIVTVLQMIKSVELKRPATFEENIASVIAWMGIYGAPSYHTIEMWLDDIGLLSTAEWSVEALRGCIR